ncbi:unnamed protein product [Anisakis simplex]|uniref:SH2 domain-containing protein n=1 Tax=Anisakis simplex TaxID=6269 RepID=A0A0M3J5U0_ANISI|nr:unnamed protein product [Anisakis simplex]
MSTIADAEWFHGHLSRTKACELLQDNGDFLVRIAQSKADRTLKAVLSVKWMGRHYHFEIRERNGLFYVEGYRFYSMVDLISHYLNEQVCGLFKTYRVFLSASYITIIFSEMHSCVIECKV